MDPLPSPGEVAGEASPLWNVLIVSDEAQFLEGIRRALLEDDVRSVGILGVKGALESLLQEVFHLVVLSCTKIGSAERGFLKKAMEIDDTCPVFLIIDHWEQVEEVREVIRPLTWTVLVRPQPFDHIRILILTALDRIRLQREVSYLRHRESYIHQFNRIVGNSEHIQEVLRLVQRVAPSDATVLIQGESGTGKELIAAAIHYNSPRRNGPFVAVNCAALQDSLLESELFGHERGAFTGADRQRVGRFEQANGGTLFLDEVGDMSPKLQAKILRVLQEREFERVGGSKTIRVNVRVLAATNQDLRRAIQRRRFRQDLYYRLNVMPIGLLPLRERPEDIQPLADFFLRKYRPKDRGGPLGFSPHAIECLRTYHWPGNVRELENVIERATLVSQDVSIQPEDLMLPPETEGEACAVGSIRLPPGGTRLEDVERDLIIQAISRAKGVQKKAAQLLGISPRTIHYKIRKYGIRYNGR